MPKATVATMIFGAIVDEGVLVVAAVLVRACRRDRGALCSPERLQVGTRRLDVGAADAIDNARISSGWRSITSRICRNRSGAARHAIHQIRTVEGADENLGRFPSCNCAAMSLRTRRSRSRCKRARRCRESYSFNSASVRYSGRKSCPQSLMQCASSMAMNDSCTPCRKLNVCSVINRSGDRYSSLVGPPRICIRHVAPLGGRERAVDAGRRHAAIDRGCRPGPSSAKSAAKPPAPGPACAGQGLESRVTCRRQWGGRPPNRGRRRRPASLRPGVAETRRSPSICASSAKDSSASVVFCVPFKAFNLLRLARIPCVCIPAQTALVQDIGGQPSRIGHVHVAARCLPYG